MRSFWGVLAAAVHLAAITSSSPPAAKRATVCNGHAELCKRSYGNITYIGAHNSYAYSRDPFALARDQEVDVTTQLTLGVRLLQAQAHMNNGVLHFCHTTCRLFDGGSVSDYLLAVRSFLETNPNEVITLIFTNPESLNLPDVWAPVFTASGIIPYMYIPTSLPVAQSDWPTLGQLIDSGKRLVFFMDYGANGGFGGVIDYILPEFEMIWETPFSQTNASFPCSIDRIAGPLPNGAHMYMINHSLNVNILPIGGGVIVSDPLHASTTNGITSILANAYGCAPFASGRAPNFVLLDFVDIGNAFQAADILNGLPHSTSLSPSSTATRSTSVSVPSATSAAHSQVSIEWFQYLSAFFFILTGLGI